MDQELHQIEKFNLNLRHELEEFKLAYSNLLHDVLSFNELLAKKENTSDILILVLRLARSIIDMDSAAILKCETDEFNLVHSIGSNSLFKKLIDDSIANNYYKEVINEKSPKIIPVTVSVTRILVPIVTKQQAMGILDMLVELPSEAIKQQDLDLLWVLSSIAAIEYESVEMSSRTELLSLLLNGLEKINSEDKLENLLYLILNNLKQIVPASNYLLILRDKLLEAIDNTSYCVSDVHSLDSTCQVVADVVNTKCTHFIKRLSANPLCTACTETHLLKDNDGSLMLVPLYKGSTAFGVITIFDKDENGNIFSHYNRHIIEIFAKQATIAINNAILYDQQKRSNANLALANEELSAKNNELDTKRKELLQKQEELQKAHDELSRWNTIISKELELAGLVQSALLSKTEISEELKTIVTYRPHHSIGGDYFGIKTIDDHRTFIYIGDVSGKGVPAAITTGYLKNEFSFSINHLKLSNELSPARVLTNVNSSAMEVFKATSQFTSAWCGIFNSKDKTLTFASAGHDYPIIIGNSVDFLDYNNGPIMGLIDNLEYKDVTIDFSFPIKLLLYTDGITDQEIKGEKRLTRDWLRNKIDEIKDKPAEEISKIIIDEVLELSIGIPQHDDMLTIMVCFKE